MMLCSSVALAADTTVTNTANAESATYSGATAQAVSNGQSASDGSTAVGDGSYYNQTYNSTYNKGSDMGDMVGAAIAPALTTTLTETCMGSTSIGAGWSGGGVSFGTTWRDSACVRRLDARELKNIHPNFAIAAKEMMCDSDKVYEAFKRAGMPCVVQVDKEPEGYQEKKVVRYVPAPAPKKAVVSKTPAPKVQKAPKDVVVYEAPVKATPVRSIGSRSPQLNVSDQGTGFF